MLFRREHIVKILRGEKTQTRRRHLHPRRAGRIYSLQRGYRDRSRGEILILKVRRQHLGEMTEEEARAEGYPTLEAFQRVWEEINGQWNPDEEVWVYEFRHVRRAPLKGSEEA